MSDSVLQYGVRNVSTESGPEPDSQNPVRNLFRTQIPYSSTEYGARVRSPVRSPFPETQYGIHFGRKLRTPVRSPELVKIPYSVLQYGIFVQLRTPVRSTGFCSPLRTGGRRRYGVLTPPVYECVLADLGSIAY